MSKKIDKLVEQGLKNNSCVLFIGPEFLRFEGKNYNAAFYETLPESDDEEEDDDVIDNKKAKYNTDEKIWSFASRTTQDIVFEQMSNFIAKNRDISDDIFLKLAEIPFPLIVSLLPDDTLDVAFKQYRNISHSFKSFFIDNDVPEVSPENMLIYNMFGNIKYGEFVASHSDYLTFVMEYERIKFPANLKTAIKKSRHFVFIGFEFDKWYNILLLYILNLEKSSSKKYIIKEQSTKELLKKLQDNSLRITFIDGDIREFIDTLHDKSASEGILREVVPKDKLIMEQIKTNKQTIVETRNLLNVTTIPTDRQRLKMDIEKLQKENNKLVNELINK